MPRLMRNITPLGKKRMNAGKRIADIVEATNLSQSTISRFERGLEISRLKAAIYLSYWDIELDDPSTWPEGWKFVDKGSGVSISLEEETPTH